MRRHHAMVRLGEGGDALALGEAAGPGDVRLHDVDRTAGDQLAETVKPGLGLIAGDGRVERVGDAGAAVDIVGGDRLLDPEQLIGRHLAAHLDREGRAPGAIDIDHQLSLRPERLAYRGDAREVLGRVGLAEIDIAGQLAQMRAGRRVAADLHLHAFEATGAVALRLAGDAVDPLPLLVKTAAGIGLDAVAARSQQLVDRELRDLAGDVPQRDVDAADRVEDEAAPAVLPGPDEHALPQPFDHQRVLADERGFQVLLDHCGGDAAADPGLADADNAVIRLDLDQHRPAPALHTGRA